MDRKELMVLQGLKFSNGLEWDGMEWNGMGAQL